MTSLRVATVAVDNVWADKNANIELTEKHVCHIKKQSPDTQVILFPEMNLTGYILDESNQELAEPMDGPTVQAIQNIAQKNDVAIIASMIGQGTTKPHNTVFVVGDDGKLLTHYNKNHLFTECAEPELYAPGEELVTFDLHGWKCGLSICFDIRFHRLFETYKKAGVECMFSPFNWVKGRNKVNLFDCLIKTRAHENQFFFVAVDRSGFDPNTSYHGISLVANPFGEDIAEHDGIYSIAELDKSEIKALSNMLPLDKSFKEKYEIRR